MNDNYEPCFFIAPDGSFYMKAPVYNTKKPMTLDDLEYKLALIDQSSKTSDI